LIRQTGFWSYRYSVGEAGRLWSAEYCWSGRQAASHTDILLVRQTGCWSGRQTAGRVDRMLYRQTDCWSGGQDAGQADLLVKQTSS
jgi:hypothetical protein